MKEGFGSYLLRATAVTLLLGFAASAILGSGLWLLGAPVVMSYVATGLIGLGVGVFLCLFVASEDRNERQIRKNIDS